MSSAPELQGDIAQGTSVHQESASSKALARQKRIKRLREHREKQEASTAATIQQLVNNAGLPENPPAGTPPSSAIAQPESQRTPGDHPSHPTSSSSSIPSPPQQQQQQQQVQQQVQQAVTPDAVAASHSPNGSPSGDRGSGSRKRGKDRPDEDKRKKRLVRNREAAQASRERKKAYIQSLERKAEEQKAKITLLEQENTSLRQKLANYEPPAPSSIPKQQSETLKNPNSPQK